MAIAQDAYTDLTASVTVSSKTFSHTNGAISNTLLIVFVAMSNDQTPSGVTYNGVSMTQIGSTAVEGGTRTYYLFWLKNPTTGTNNVVVTATGTANEIYAGAASYTGVDQTNPIETSTAANSLTGTTPNTSITTANANEWLVALWRNDTGAVSSSTNQTVRGASSSIRYADSNGTVGTGSVTAQVSVTGGLSYVVVSALKPSSASSQFRSLLGVGV